jgi:peptidyl-prolyl cis-trans isomerase C
MKKSTLVLFVVMGVLFNVNFAFGRDTKTPVVKKMVEPAAAETGEKAVAPEVVQNANQVIMIFDGRKLTLGQLQYIAGDKLDPETIKKVAEYWLDAQLLYEEAVRQGLDKDEKSRFIADMDSKKVFANAVVEKALSKIKIDDSQVKKYYDENKDADPSLQEPMYLSFSHITVDSQEKAQDVLKKLNEGGDINALARELSIASDAKAGGRATKYQKNIIESKYGKEFFDALLGASEGKLIGPIKTKDGKYEVAMHEGKREPKIKEFDKVSAQIKAKLENDARRNTVDGLLKKLRENAKARYVEKGVLAATDSPVEQSKEKAPNGKKDKK